ncbi:MAG: hypothetical protein LBS28_01210 [Streptococcaceae bacterium]|nr:hypothetical protein [Streptococcaceae bacterium]
MAEIRSREASSKYSLHKLTRRLYQKVKASSKKIVNKKPDTGFLITVNLILQNSKNFNLSIPVGECRVGQKVALFNVKLTDKSIE